MADHTGIEWTDATWNPVVGCSLVSPGCTNCYAMGQAARIVRCSEGLGRASAYDGTVETVKGRPVWTGKVALASEATLTQPLRWQKPRRIFVNSMGDLFHEGVPDEWIDRVFAVMALAPQHTYQILTKRSARMRRYMTPTTTVPMLGRLPLERVHLAAAADYEGDDKLWEQLKRHGNLYSLYCSVPWPLPNVWLGISAEDQRRANERIPDLLVTPAAIRFVSNEPALGGVDYRRIRTAHPSYVGVEAMLDALTGQTFDLGDTPIGELNAKLDWIIVGGESGPNARPMHPDWARSIRDQCAAAGTAFFFKQWGEWLFETQIGDGQHPSDRYFNADGNPIDEKPPFGPSTGRLWHWWEPKHHASICIGKARAGRLLDGVTHDAMPEVRRG